MGETGVRPRCLIEVSALSRSLPSSDSIGSVRAFSFLFCVALAALQGCGGPAEAPKSEPKAPAAPAAPKPSDESRRFPKKDQVDAKLVPDHVLAKDILPGGTVATYKKGKTGYEMFVVKYNSPGAAAVALLDLKSTLETPKFIAHFGGYSGTDAGKPMFIYTKGAWLAGVRGLPEAEADAISREFAAKLN